MIFSLIKLVMKECGLTQAALAEVLGVNLDRVKSITSGRAKKLTREESEALVKKLRIRAEWLVTGDGPMFQAVDAAAEAHQVSENVRPYGLSADEGELLRGYRSSTPDVRAAALRMLSSPTEPPPLIKPPKRLTERDSDLPEKRFKKPAIRGGS